MADQTLPPVVVYGSPSDPTYGLGATIGTFGSGYVGGSGPTGGVDPTVAFMNSMPNGKACYAALQNNDQMALLQAFFEGLSGRNAAFIIPQLQGWGNFTQYLAAGGWKQLAGATQYTFPDNTGTAVVPLSTIYVKGGKTNYATSPDFYGNPLLFISGIYYWIKGGGAARSVNIASLKLNMDQNLIPPLAAAIAANAPGSYGFANTNFSFNVFDAGLSARDAAGLLGHVDGDFSGTLTIGGDGSWSFNGDFGVHPDVYDANAGNRTLFQEAGTTFLRALGDTFGHNDYQINILGRQSLSLSGHR